MFSTFKYGIAAAFAAIVLAPAAAAQVGVEQVSVRVAYGDLDPSSMSDAETLLKRIKVAARQVCRELMTHSPLMPRSEFACRRKTVETAVRQLDIGTLTLAWSGRQTATSLAAR